MIRAPRILIAAVAAALAVAAPATAAFTAQSTSGGSAARAGDVFKPRQLTAPALTGVARQKQSLTGTDGTWARNPASIARTWLRCDAGADHCTPIAGATASSYVLTASDLGARVRLRVTATNAGGATTATSAPTDVVQPPQNATPPASTTAPAITGAAVVDEMLSADPGTWTGAGTTFAYQWMRCASASSCTDLAGETGRRLRLESADAARTIRVRVTATNDGGSASATSAPTVTIGRRAFTYLACANPATGLGVGPATGLPPGFTLATNDELRSTATSSCAVGTGAPGVFEQITGGWSTTPAAGLRIRYTTPANLTLLGGEVFRASRFAGPLSTSFTTGPNGAAFNGEPVWDTCWHNFGCTGQGTPSRPFDAGNTSALSTSSPGGFGYTLHCHTNGYRCEATGWHAIYGGRLQLRDEVVPAVASATGTLVDGASLPPAATLALDARDSGSGLYRVRVLVDDAEVAAQVVHPNGGLCADAGPGNDDPYEFATHTPCVASYTGQLTFATTAWPQGTHRLHVLLEDAGHNTVMLSKRTVAIGG